MVERKTPTNGPTIIFGKDLQNVPYTVTVDIDQAAQMYKEAGFTDEEIAQQSIVIDKGKIGRNGKVTVGKIKIYSNNHKVYIYIDWSYKDRDFTRRATNNILSLERAKDLPEYSLPFLQSPRRFSRYLRTAPRKRATDFSKKLLDRVHDRQINDVLSHEIYHQLEVQKRPQILKKYKTFAAINYLTAALPAISLAILAYQKIPLQEIKFEGAFLTYFTSFLPAFKFINQFLYRIDLSEKNAHKAEDSRDPTLTAIRVRAHDTK